MTETEQLALQRAVIAAFEALVRGSHYLERVEVRVEMARWLSDEPDEAVRFRSLAEDVIDTLGRLNSIRPELPGSPDEP